MRIKLTDHASDQMYERGITLDQVKNCIKKGAKSRQGKKEFISHYSYYQVAYVKLKDLYIIKTVMIK